MDNIVYIFRFCLSVYGVCPLSGEMLIIKRPDTERVLKEVADWGLGGTGTV